MLLLSEKVRPLRVEKDRNWLVLMRNTTAQDDRFGRWEPVARLGYVVVCPSRKEAIDLVMVVGGRVFQAPPHLCLNDTQYVRWLLDNHFRLMPNYTVTGKREMMFAEWIRGWVPDDQSFLRGEASPLIVHRCLDDQRIRSGAGDLIEAVIAMERPKV